MKKVLRWTVITVLSLLLLCTVAAGCFVRYFVPKTAIKDIVEEVIDKNITSEAKLDTIDFTLLSSFPNVAVILDRFLIYDSVSLDTVIYIDRTSVALNTLDLLDKKISVKNITVTKPYVNFFVDSLGYSNLDSLVKVPEKKSEAASPVINLNDISIREARIDYHNISTGKNVRFKRINFDFRGCIDLKDSILDIRHGKFHVGDNSIGFNGHIDPRYVDITLTHDLDNLNNIALVTSLKQLEETEIYGHFEGETRIVGQLDNSFDSISVMGHLKAEDVKVNSSKHAIVVQNGELSANFRYDIGSPDSSYVILDTMRLQGDNISVATSGKLTHKDSDLYIDAHLQTEGNMTVLSKQTALIPKGEEIRGNFKADVNVSSSLDELIHGYRFPKSLKKLYDLDFHTKIPNIDGTIDIANLKIANDTLQVKADRINFTVDGKRDYFTTKFDNFLLSRDGKIENTTIKAKKGRVDINGKKSTASVKISEAGLVDVVGDKDSIIAVTSLVKMDLGKRGSKFAEGCLESFSYRRGVTRLTGAKINGSLSKSSKTSRKTWDTGSAEIYISRFEKDNLDLFCKRVTGTFRYDGKLSGLRSAADSIHLKAADNELYLKGVSIKAEKDGYYKLFSKTANTERVVIGLGININNLDALYHKETGTVNLKTGKVTVGKSEFSAAGKIDFSKKMPVVDVNLVGKYLSINDMMVAGNRMNLAMGNPNAIPLDSIPPGKLPRSGGKDGKNMSIGLKLDKMTLTSLEMSNVTGEILMRDKATLINNLRSHGNGYSLCLNTKYTFVNRGLSITDILLDFDNLDISELPTVMPSFADVTPMLSALKGTVKLKLAISTPVRYFIGINLKEGKAAASLQAKNLSISDNETFREVAKTLMFKNKESTRIDSLDVAATIANAQVKFYPFMITVDRYKVGMYGENDMITKNLNYHISVIKSPVPFKFGIDITGIPKYKIKLVKSGYKVFDPNIKPWANSEYQQFNSSLIKPITDFKNSIKR